MGSEIGFKKVSHLRLGGLGILALILSLFSLGGAQGHASLQTLTVHVEFRPEQTPLTTEAVWTLDPDQLNPHRKLWIVSRHTDLDGLTVVQREKGRFGVEATGIHSLVQGYVRGPGSWWYSAASQRSCVGTQEEARRATVKASEVWDTLLRRNLIKLSLTLKRIRANSENGAISGAKLAFKSWLKSVDSEWRLAMGQLDQTQECSGGKGAMEPVTGPAPSVTSLLARAPVRIWNGYFSVRLSVKIAGKTLNGRFLIDSGSNQSVLSPAWLENQGIYPVWIEIPHAPLVRISGSDLWKGERPLARSGEVDAVELSGFHLPMTDFALAATDFFAPPQNVGTCCDGVLGVDFLRKYPIEFSAGPPAEVRVWPKENFHWSEDTPWIEVSETADGRLLTSSGTALKMPDILLSSPSTTFDIPHGRIWFSKGNAPQQEQPRKNISGLKLKYKMEGGERILRVIEIQHRSPAQELVKAGLRVGMAINRVDSTPAEDLDEWTVDRKLAGLNGSVISLEWKTKQGLLKIAPLRVQPR